MEEYKYSATSIELRRDTLANKRNLATACAVVLVHWILGLKGIPFFGNVEISAHGWVLHVVMAGFVGYFVVTYGLNYWRDKSDWMVSTGLDVGYLKPLQDWRDIPPPLRNPLDDPIEPHKFRDPVLTDAHLRKATVSLSTAQKIYEDWLSAPGISTLGAKLPEFPAVLAESRRLYQQHQRILSVHQRTSLVVNVILPALLALAALITAVSRAIAAAIAAS